MRLTVSILLSFVLLIGTNSALGDTLPTNRSPLSKQVDQYSMIPSAFAGSDEVVLVGEPVAFFGYGASPDAEIVEYTWDFESDGKPDFVSTTTGSTTYIFKTPGRYQCLFTVKDSMGLLARDSRLIIAVVDNVDVEASREMLHPARPSVVRNAADGVTHRYAIMINGGYESRYWTDVELGYDMLVNGYGFSTSDVYLLNSNGTDPEGGNPDGMIDYSARSNNLEIVFNELATKVDEDDEVFIWITDHGRGYSGPLSEGGKYIGYMDGRTSVDPGDEPDFPESAFPLRSIFTGGDYRCNHGMNVWKVRRKYSTSTKTNFYRNKYVSQLDKVYIESLGTTVSDSDIYIERLVDYAMGDTNRDGYIDTGAGEVFDYDGDGNDPYDPDTGVFDEDDWGAIDNLSDDYNSTGGGLPEGAYPYKLFDEGFQGKLCIDLNYAGGIPEVDGRDDDNAGLFDWMDVNQDGDTNDTVSVDEAICLYSGDFYDDDLAALVGQLLVAKVTILAEPCFSGGIIEDLTSPNRVISTATIEEAVSWGNVFIREFTAALHGQDENGTPVNADTDENGYISMLEAFNYATGEDYTDEIPQYDDNGDGVSQTAPVPAGGDGTLGSNTYLCDLGTETIPTPMFTPDGGRYDSTQSVVISCANPGATIYYTIDNTIPTTSSMMYTGPVLVDKRMILKAKAYETGWLPSAIKEAVYFIPAEKVIHVKPDGNDGNDGLTWNTAKQTITGGLAAAAYGDEVWVKGDSNSPYSECVVLKDGAALYGGFLGSETSFGQRPVFPRPADDPNQTIIDGGQQDSVVKLPSEAIALTEVDGLTIRNGLANYGGGIYCDSGTPAIRNCIISTNSANDGGGIYCASYSSPTISNCIIMSNSAEWNGGGIHCSNASSPTLCNCTIIGNSAGVWGGGFSCYSYSSPSQPKLSNCLIADNSCGQEGGGIYCREGALTTTNCTLSGNSSDYSGGGFYCRNSISMIANCIFWRNTAGYYGDQIKVGTTYSPSQLTVSYSDIEGGQAGVHIDSVCTLVWGDGNIDVNPMFMDPDGPDDNPVTWEDNSYRLLYGSPCVDAGDNTAVPADTVDLDADGDSVERIPFDLDGYPRFFDTNPPGGSGIADPPAYPAIVDMGAYEFSPKILADFDYDGDVDSDDIDTFQACRSGPTVPYDPENLPQDCWLTPNAQDIIAADFDSDNDVDQADFGVFQRCYSGENNPADPNCDD